MAQMAKEIYSKHLCIGAQEPVNVDSHARQVAQEGLESPGPDLFLPAQKQVSYSFNTCNFVHVYLKKNAYLFFHGSNILPVL